MASKAKKGKVMKRSHYQGSNLDWGRKRDQNRCSEEVTWMGQGQVCTGASHRRGTERGRLSVGKGVKQGRRLHTKAAMCQFFPAGKVERGLEEWERDSMAQHRGLKKP